MDLDHLDVSSIKQEEPADFSLISTNEGEVWTIKTEGAVPNDAESMEITPINIKEEPKTELASKEEQTHNLDDVNNDSDAATSEYEPESEESDSDDVINENDSDEDWTFIKSSTPKSLKLKGQKSFQCNICYANFRTKYKFKHHLYKHNNLSDMSSCTICKKFFSNEVIPFHMVLHGGPPYTCMLCEKSFQSKDSFRHHRFIHKEKRYECDICHKLFRQKGNIVSHMDIHRERKKPFQCQLCGIWFHRKNTMYRHQRHLHTVGPRMKYKCPNTSCNREYVRITDLHTHKCRIKKEPRVFERKYECPSCELRFFTTTKMQSHFNRVHGENAKQFFCDLCKRRFRNIDCLVLHRLQKCPKKIKYECDMCSKVMKEKIRLMEHFGHEHNINELKTIPCSSSNCDRLFVTHRRVKVHFQCVHMKQLKPDEPSTFECEYCNQIFQRRTSYKQHMNRKCFSHETNVTNYSIDSYELRCSICEILFIQKSDADAHMQTVHSKNSVPTVDKKFNCSASKKIMQQYKCNQQSCIDNNVDGQHIHTDKCKFECKKCRISFGNYYALLRHSAKHYQRVGQCLSHLQRCTKCSKKLQNETIPEHLQIEDIRNLKCETCQKTFRYKGPYMTHVSKCSIDK